MDRSGKAEQFRAKWTSLGLGAREFYLRKCHESLHELSDTYVFEIAERQESDWKRIDQKAFKAPLLNMEDLLYSDNLPCLIESRLKHHPRLFLSVDGRGVTTGLFCAVLPELPCDSRLSINLGNEGYSFLWDEKGPCNPAAVFHQLEAQSQLYCFLLACIKNSSLELSPPEVESKIRAPPSTFTAQMAQIDYAPLNSIDFPFILSLLKCSLNDATDDLYDLRTDAELWSTRVSSTAQDGRCATFLRKVLVRIDCFDRLKSLVDTLLRDGLSSSVWDIEDVHGYKGYMALEVALQCALDEITSTLSKGKWPKRISNGTLSGLLNLIKTQNTTLWVMGHRIVLRAIDREISKEGDRGGLPSEMMRALHDMSVVAYCLRESQKYHFFRQSLQDERSAQLSQELEDDWKKHKGILHSLSVDTLDAMGPENGKKLDVLFLRTDITTDTKHEQFWNRVDKLMDKASSGRPTRVWFEKIQSDAPIELGAPGKIVQIQQHCSPAPDLISRTQIQRSKRRATIRTDASEATSRTVPKREAASSMKITISSTLPDGVFDFWKTLIN